MDLQNLRNNYSLLLSYMESKNYKRQYIRFIEKEIHWILKESEYYKWKTYDDIYRTYVEKWKNKYTLANRRRGLLVIKRFDLESRMPDGLKHYRKPSNYDFLCSEFQHFIEVYRKAIESVPSKSYFKSVEYTACSFLLKLQKAGINCLDLITEKDVLKLFSTDEKISKSYDFKYNVEVAFKTCAPFYANSLCSRIISYLPNFQKIKKNVQCLSKSEIEKIKFILDNDSSVSLQNKAICLLALYTGLRSCDIATFSLDEIDWENDLICVKQNKTGNPLALPLRAIVGNALFDYITKERPQSSERFIFLTVNAPYRRLHTTNLNAICVSIMDKAGIRNKPNERRGFHLFRHYVATSLLGNGVEQPIISSTLGHQSPNSLNSYLSADFVHLKGCSLSINDFPFRKEVFES